MVISYTILFVSASFNRMPFHPESVMENEIESVVCKFTKTYAIIIESSRYLYVNIRYRHTHEYRMFSKISPPLGNPEIGKATSQTMDARDRHIYVPGGHWEIINLPRLTCKDSHFFHS